VYKTEDGYASLNSGAHKNGESQMFGPIINSKEFLARLLAGEAKAWDLLYEQGVNNVVPLCRSLRLYEPEDAWHYTWLDIRLTNCSGYDPSRGEFSNWIFLRATDRARDNQREALRFQPIDDVSELASQESDTEENESGHQEKMKLLKQASRTLKKDERKLLWLRYGLGRKSPAIAKQLGTTSVTVRKRISRALKRLRQEIERLREDELRRSIEGPSRADSS
jgi:RNA polymerase sigma factor (sigma-70 family)